MIWLTVWVNNSTKMVSFISINTLHQSIVIADQYQVIDLSFQFDDLPTD